MGKMGCSKRFPLLKLIFKLQKGGSEMSKFIVSVLVFLVVCFISVTGFAFDSLQNDIWKIGGGIPPAQRYFDSVQQEESSPSPEGRVTSLNELAPVGSTNRRLQLSEDPPATWQGVVKAGTVILGFEEGSNKLVPLTTLEGETDVDVYSFQHGELVQISAWGQYVEWNALKPGHFTGNAHYEGRIQGPSPSVDPKPLWQGRLLNDVPVYGLKKIGGNWQLDKIHTAYAGESIDVFAVNYDENFNGYVSNSAWIQLIPLKNNVVIDGWDDLPWNPSTTTKTIKLYNDEGVNVETLEAMNNKLMQALQIGNNYFADFDKLVSENVKFFTILNTVRGGLATHPEIFGIALDTSLLDFSSNYMAAGIWHEVQHIKRGPTSYSGEEHLNLAKETVEIMKYVSVPRNEIQFYVNAWNSHHDENYQLDSF